MYVELRTASGFSFLESPSQPEDLIQTAAELGYPALTLIDAQGFYGLPRFHMAAKKAGLKAQLGASVNGPNDARFSFLIRTQQGYQNLSQLLTRIKLRAGRKGEGWATWADLEEYREGLILLSNGTEGSMERLRRLYGAHLYLEIQRHYDRRQESQLQKLVALSERTGVPLVATNGVNHARRNQRELLDIVTCIRHKTTLEQAGRLLSINDERHLKSPKEMAALFRDLPQAVSNTLRISESIEYTMANLGYEFPRYPVPEGESMASFLQKRAWEGARNRYGSITEKVKKQIERELKLIEQLGLEGYFLIVWDIINFCKGQGILVQGRGSAANSAVCYSLGITAVDPIGMELLFERFLSEERGEWPDIDLDLPSGERRERAIQYVYERYGQLGAAMTANVITYRGRMATREVGKVMEFAPDVIDRLAKVAYSFEFRDANETAERRFTEAGLDLRQPYVRKFFELSLAIQDLPRHLGQHSGGMVICQGQLDRVVPLEPASMPGRVVVQWDKECCADMGLIKVDLLGLGMMAALEETLVMIKDHYGEEVELAKLPADDPGVYEDLQKADTIGVFQVESRAQQASLPRMKPKKFYDIVVQTAIIRPGPIVGKMVHPYVRRRQGREEPDPLHPLLEPILSRTLGVPLFQEQLLRMAMVAANFTGGEAEELRRALGFKRSRQRMEELEGRLRKGMTENGILGHQQDSIITSISSFALYGFPESHAASFALIAYASIYLRRHYRAAFTAALLNNQPMGFYHPDSLVRDAQRHGLRILPVDVTRSSYLCTVEHDGRAHALRLGFNYVKSLRRAVAERLEAERAERGPYQSMEDLLQRVPELHQDEVRQLSKIGALNHVDGEKSLHRRSALWKSAAAVRRSGPLLEQLPLVMEESPLRQMGEGERLMADYLGTTVSIGRHPMAMYRERLGDRPMARAADLAHIPGNRWVTVAGAVIIKQRPGTAKGFCFISLEDETGISNIICEPDFYDENRSVLKTASFLIVTGVLQNLDGALSIKAKKVEPLMSALAMKTRWG